MNTLPAIAACAALAAYAAPPATQWAREEFTNYAAQVFGAAPDVRFVLPGETADFADDFAALKGTDGYAVRRQGDVHRRLPQGTRQRRLPLA